MYQGLQTSITTDIITLGDFNTYTQLSPIQQQKLHLTKLFKKSSKEIAKENKAVEKRIKESY